MADKQSTVNKLLLAKEKSRKTYSEIAKETGLSNVYVAQLLRRQAPFPKDAETAAKLREALPELTDDLVTDMKKFPFRSYDPNIIQEPAIYRLHEAAMHYGESIKEIINEEFGDGIMSAIDFYCSVDKVKGTDGNDRVVITFDGKYLPYSEHRKDKMVTIERGEQKLEAPGAQQIQKTIETEEAVLDANHTNV